MRAFQILILALLVRTARADTCEIGPYPGYPLSTLQADLPCQNGYYELTSISVTGIPAGVMTYAYGDGDGYFTLWLESSSGPVTIENAIDIDIEGILPPPLSCGNLFAVACGTGGGWFVEFGTVRSTLSSSPGPFDFQAQIDPPFTVAGSTALAVINFNVPEPNSGFLLFTATVITFIGLSRWRRSKQSAKSRGSAV